MSTIRKLCGVQVDTSLFKKRKGFRFIVIDGKPYQFTWARGTPVQLILYDQEDKKQVFKVPAPAPEWRTIDPRTTWHGKNYDDACFGGWGKREAADLYRHYQ